jgi:hypothetical protein
MSQRNIHTENSVQCLTQHIAVWTSTENSQSDIDNGNVCVSHVANREARWNSMGYYFFVPSRYNHFLYFYVGLFIPHFYFVLFSLRYVTKFSSLFSEWSVPKVRIPTWVKENLTLAVFKCMVTNDGGRTFLGYVNTYLPDYTVSHS